ncbi:MAG: helix-turn-helix transcriptional regulator [Ilumatobacter sp.]
MAAGTSSISDTQRRVLVAVKRHGEITADELAHVMGITASGVRQHLASLRAAGLVEADKVRGQPGRPVDRYRATVDTEPLFETTDGDFSIELLADIEAEQPDIVDRVFERRRQRQVETARERVDGRPIAERVEIVTELLDEQGFLADHEQLGDHHFRINLHNCPIWTVANRFRQACSAELDLLRELIPDATVQRVTHKTAGAHTCAYDIAGSR